MDFSGMHSSNRQWVVLYAHLLASLFVFLATLDAITTLTGIILHDQLRLSFLFLLAIPAVDLFQCKPSAKTWLTVIGWFFLILAASFLLLFAITGKTTTISIQGQLLTRVSWFVHLILSLAFLLFGFLMLWSKRFLGRSDYFVEREKNEQTSTSSENDENQESPEIDHISYASDRIPPGCWKYIYGAVGLALFVCALLEVYSL